MAHAAADVEMADACISSSSTTSNLSPPPSFGSEYEDLSQRTRENSLNQPPTSLENINLDSPVTGTELANMRRSTRNTNKPKPVIVTSPSKPAKRKVTKVVKKMPKWTTEKLLTDPKSPLANADLRAILCQPAAWDILSKEERAQIIALFPAGTRILNSGTDDARPDLDALRNDNNFRHDCATYVENIAQGKHDPDWLEQAWAARERRRAGDFDGYLKQKFEDEWSCELPEEFMPKRDGDAPAAVATAKDKVEAETELEAKAVGVVKEPKVSEEAPRKDVGVLEVGEVKEELDAQPESSTPQASKIKLGSPVPEESHVKLGSPFPKSHEEKLQRDGENAISEEKPPVADGQEGKEKPHQQG